MRDAISDTQAATISADWIGWLRDYASTATRFSEEDTIAVATGEERELVAIKAALYARALTLEKLIKGMVDNG